MSAKGAVAPPCNLLIDPSDMAHTRPPLLFNYSVCKEATVIIHTFHLWKEVPINRPYLQTFVHIQSFHFSNDLRFKSKSDLKTERMTRWKVRPLKSRG